LSVTIIGAVFCLSLQFVSFFIKVMMMMMMSTP